MKYIGADLCASGATLAEALRNLANTAAALSEPISASYITVLADEQVALIVHSDDRTARTTRASLEAGLEEFAEAIGSIDQQLEDRLQEVAAGKLELDVYFEWRRRARAARQDFVERSIKLRYQLHLLRDTDRAELARKSDIIRRLESAKKVLEEQAAAAARRVQRQITHIQELQRVLSAKGKPALVQEVQPEE